MSTSQQVLLGYGGSGFVIPRSLRFRASASAYLNRTFGTPTSNTTWTLSLWLKRGALPGGSTRNDIFSAGTEEIIFYQGTEVLQLRSGSASTAVFRDISAWYHLVIVSNGTTVKGYINNSEVVSYTGTMTSFNSAAAHTIGQYQNNLAADGFFDGYMAEINFVDGQALATTSFGATSTTTGVWSPIKYTGTYGNNGFHLDFNSYATQAALGTDTSGNSNTWTVNNCSVTAGVTYDSMIDVPTVTDTGSNYCVLAPIAKGSQVTGISEGNLKVDGWSGVNGDGGIGTMQFPTSGKWKFEVTNTGTWTGLGVGIALEAVPYPYLTSATQVYGFTMNGGKLVAGVNTNGLWAAAATTDVITIIYDATNATIECKKNNTSMLTLTGLPAGNYFPYYGYNGGSTGTPQFTFGQRPFTYTDTGVNALNTYNLAAPSILKGNLYMDATTYTGTGASLSVTNAGGFQPDFVWAKSRSAATDHALYDSVRGTTKQLESNTTTAETTEATGLTAFDSTGFTVGALAQMNTSAATYVGWQWKGGGAAVTNTSGSITSSVSANTTSGCSVVIYTGTGANATVGHGLGVAPRMMIIKQRSGGASSGVNDWNVYHASLTSAVYYIRLNLTNAEVSNATVWNSTAPSSTVFSLGSQQNSNELNGLMVAYCFAPIAGYSAFGSYTGNGSADGPFIYCGFRPRWVLLKKTSAVGHWFIYDTARDTYNLAFKYLQASDAGAENTTGTANVWDIDILSNGFKIRNDGGFDNASSATYIYAAFAENPFNNSLAR